MHEFTEKALILRVGRFREADLWVRLFTRSRGRVNAFAFGGLRSVRRFCGCLDNFNLVNLRFRFSKRQEYLYLEEGTLLSSHPRLRKDPARLGQAVNCLKFFEALHEGCMNETARCSGESAASFDLLLETLDCLEHAPHISDFFPVLFRLKATFLEGWSIEADTCSLCGKQLLTSSSAASFLVEEGRMACEACRPQGFRLNLNPEALEVLDLVQRTGPADWESLIPAGNARGQCWDAAEYFIRRHPGLAMDNGRWRRV